MTSLTTGTYLTTGATQSTGAAPTTSHVVHETKGRRS
jgi:hypothetical protein